MVKVKIYRFQTYDIISDQIKVSRRWGTREAIADKARGEVLEHTEVDVLTWMPLRLNRTSLGSQ